MKKQKHRTSSGKMSERMSLLEFLKERSGIRLSKLEAYLDLVDKASVQYIPKDLCKQNCYFTRNNSCPNSTNCASSTKISVIVPSTSLMTSFINFIASMIHTTSPFAIVSPTFTKGG